MKKYLSLITLAGLVLGILFGLFAGETTASVAFIGTWYVNILKVFIGPVIFTSIACTIYETSKKKSRTVLKSVLCFCIMFVCTFLLTSIMVVLLDPGKGFSFVEENWSGKTIGFSFASMIKNLFPTSLKEIFISPKVFAIIVFSYLVGRIGALIKGSEPVFRVIDVIKKYLFKALDIFMYVTPLAAFSLIGVTVHKYGSILLGVGLKYILVALLGSVLCLVVIMILPVFFIAKMSPAEYIRKVYRIWLMTLTTCSSAATLPYTVKLCRDELGIPAEITDVVVPLGCTIHMCGGAVSFALLGLFCAQLYGVQIGFSSYVMMIISALLINTAAPGIPGGGIVIGASYLEMMGIPLGFIGFYSGIYKFLDMMYTTLNVTGDISANIILNRLINKDK